MRARVSRPLQEYNRHKQNLRTYENESATNEWYTYLYVACCLAGSAVPVHRFGVRVCYVLLLCLLCIIMILGRDRGFKDR